MNTRVELANDAINFVAENMRPQESVLRLLASGFVVLLPFSDPALSVKLLPVVAAVYLFVTAILRWDPLYAVIRWVQWQQAAQPQAVRTSEGAMVENLNRRSNTSAANDRSTSGDDFRKAG
ncbi:MAG: DUF2892 domain-containing protein [Gammaproteobacteria bacterium]|nr:DUF2892 domain-containing protein [Gammaproteobacteria bacterium]